MKINRTILLSKVKNSWKSSSRSKKNYLPTNFLRQEHLFSVNSRELVKILESSQNLVFIVFFFHIYIPQPNIFNENWRVSLVFWRCITGLPAKKEQVKRKSIGFNEVISTPVSFSSPRIHGEKEKPPWFLQV